jgi:hypothetical protein
MLFHTFPTDIQWKWVILTKDELEKVLYINWNYWIGVTNGTRSPKYLADKIAAGELPDDKETLRFKRLAGILKSGGNFPELILVAQDKNSRLVVLEGHVRLTSYFLVPQYIPNELGVIIGFSEHMSQWIEY